MFGVVSATEACLERIWRTSLGRPSGRQAARATVFVEAGVPLIEAGGAHPLCPTGRLRRRSTVRIQSGATRRVYLRQDLVLKSLSAHVETGSVSSMCW
jgi:hypothetical protein